MSNLVVDPLFNRQETTADRTVGGQTSKIVTDLVIDTALPLVLHQDVAKRDAANHQFVPPTANLKVYGDEVTVSGRLSLPGHQVVIFARVLRAEPGPGGEAPAIVVDGPALPDDKARPAGLGRGEPTQDKPPKPKLAVGDKGKAGWNNTSIAGRDQGPGGRGQSRQEAPALMDGAPGRKGDKGNAAGQVWICCARTDFGGRDVKLLVSAVGGRGGNGQPGQPGAYGGPGGDGFNAVKDGFGGVRAPTEGGPGGQGGNGGTGGDGGPGGDGGSVVIHCIAAMPPITVTNGGGPGGDPGEGGARGERGEGGKGGHGATVRWLKVPRAHDGDPGQPGGPGSRGGAAPPSNAGGGGVKTGEPANEDLASRASVTQLHMMLERTRAVYLVTEPPTYRLQQVMVTDVKQLPAPKRNLVVLAMVGTGLHLRVFDAAGAKVVDKAEQDLAPGELLEKVRGRFEFDIGRVLVAGKWLTPRERDDKTPAEQRELLCTKMGDWSKQKPDYFRTLDDASVAACGAMAVFLRDTGIRDQAGLRTYTDNDQRNTLITENGRTGRQDLQALRNAPNVRLGLGWCGRRALRQAFLDRTGDEEQEIISEVFALTGYVDTWAGIGERLKWLERLLKAIPDKHVQYPLARGLSNSTWSALNRHRAGLDYFGKEPSFVPVLSLHEYEDALQRSLDSLSKIDSKRNDYMKQGNDLAVRRNDLSGALATTDAHLAYLKTRRDPIEEEIGKLNETIGNQNTKIDGLRPNLQRELEAFKQKVDDAFGLSPLTFFNCLSQLSFMSPHTTANPRTFVERYGGPASAVAMGVSQAGTMITEGVKNVLSDTGELVNKDYVLGEIDVVRKGLNLRTELKRRGGLFDKGSSGRLLVELDRFRELVNQFHTTLSGAGALRDRLDQYIALVTSRNQNIDAYNVLVVDLAELIAETKRLTMQKQEAEGLLGKNVDPGLPVMTTFVSQLYDRAKEECVRQVYMASRALSFWGLKPYGQFFDLIGRSPGAVTVEQLRAAATGFRKSVLDALEDNGRPPSFFPKSEDSESSLGQVVVLTPDTHADFFTALRTKGQADFTLEPATFASSAPRSPFDATTAAWSGKVRPDINKDAPNPFCTMANVRLTKVRVWLLSDPAARGNHRLLLIHLGREQFRRRNDEPFPPRTDPPHEADLDLRRPEFVEHEPVEIPFAYDATGMRLDLGKSPPVFTPGRMREDTQATVDGDLDFPGDRDLNKLATSPYAPIGPFGSWRLVVHQNENPDLKLDEVNRIVIDFHGYFHPYKLDSGPATV